MARGRRLCGVAVARRTRQANATAQTVRSGGEPRVVAAALLGELANKALSIALVLDDVHAPNEVAVDLLLYIAFNFPRNVHLIIATRSAMNY
jgi:ATP/maltotriose-dependent transcriptional regulator MalT